MGLRRSFLVIVASAIFCCFLTQGVHSQRFYGTTYSPYRQYGACPSLADIQQDAGIYVRHTNRVRLYSTECHVLNDQALEGATNLGVEVLLGLWIDGNHGRNQQEKEDLYTYIAKYPNARLLGIAVGNEVLYRGTLSPEAMAQHVREVKARVRAIGQQLGSYILQTVPIFSVEVIPHPLVVAESDAIGVNVHPFYRRDLPHHSDPNVMAEAALQSSIQQITTFQALYAGREVFVTETGWPTSSAPHEPQRGSLQVQKMYRQKFGAWGDSVGLKYFLFELVDSPWKKSQYPFEPETMSEFHWGMYDFYRVLK